MIPSKEIYGKIVIVIFHKERSLLLNYDFTILSPPEFEEFSRDIIQEHLEITFESFKDGKDGGIDFRYSINRENTILIQCKRYADYKSLKAELKKELKKVKKLIPERYILTTSVDLSVLQKEEILDLFEGFIKNTSDIIGKGDLNNYLSQYNYLERQYYKLWLSSTTIMNKIINSDVYNRSEFTEKEIKDDLSLYVQNESYEEALEVLKENNYIVISGIPGIGKSTLAKILIYKYLIDGYGLVEVSKDIDEADRLFVEGKEQVFYYDDFLGRVFLNKKLEKNEETRIMQFLRKVRRDSSKKLIMTTREYILQQAKVEYQEFERLKSCIIDLEKYSEMIKAKILYNHLFYSNVPQSYLTHLLENDNFLKIINHKNYNPRLIQYLTFDYDTYCDNEEKYFIDFLKMLDNPIELWKKPFENHISQVSRYFLYALLLFGRSVDTNKLKNGLENLIEVESEKYTIPYYRNAFNNSIVELNKSFIKVENDMVDFQNPSIQDFLINYIAKDKDLILSLINSVVYFQQLFNIFENGKRAWRMRFGKIFLDASVVKEIEDIIILRFDELEFLSEKSLRSKDILLLKLWTVASFFDIDENSDIKNLIISKLKSFDLSVTAQLNFSNFSRFMDLLDSVAEEVHIEDKKALVSQYINCWDSLDDIDDILGLEDTFPDEYAELEDEITSKVDSLIDDEIFFVDEEDLDELNELKDKIEDIENQLDIDLFFQKSEIEEKIELLEEEIEEEEEEETSVKWSINKKHIDTRTEIKSLFSSIKK